MRIFHCRGSRSDRIGSRGALRLRLRATRWLLAAHPRIASHRIAIIRVASRQGLRRPPAPAYESSNSVSVFVARPPAAGRQQQRRRPKKNYDEHLGAARRRARIRSRRALIECAEALANRERSAKSTTRRKTRRSRSGGGGGGRRRRVLHTGIYRAPARPPGNLP